MAEFVRESVRYFHQNPQHEEWVTPDNEFDSILESNISKKRRSGGGDSHILMREEVSNSLVYDSKGRAKTAVTALNKESQKLAQSSQKKNKKVK